MPIDLGHEFALGSIDEGREVMIGVIILLTEGRTMAIPFCFDIYERKMKWSVTDCALYVYRPPPLNPRNLNPTREKKVYVCARGGAEVRNLPIKTPVYL